MKFDFSNNLDLKKADTYIEKLKKKKAKVEIKEPRAVRSVDQNSYLHVCLALYCDSTGYTREEALDDFSHLLPEIMRYDKNGRNYRRSTTSLDSREMSILIEKIRSICSEELGIYVPESEEYLINKFAIDKEIQYVK